MLCRRCAVGLLNNIGQSCQRHEVEVFWNTDSRHIQWGSGVGEESSWCDAFLWWKLKTCVLKREDLQTGEVGTNLDGPNWGNRRFLFITRERHDPFLTRALYTMLDVVWAKDEVIVLHRLEFVMMPHTSVCRRRDALIIGDDTCGALLLRARMISPTRLPKVMGYVGNIAEVPKSKPELEVLETVLNCTIR